MNAKSLRRRRFEAPGDDLATEAGPLVTRGNGEKGEIGVWLLRVTGTELTQAGSHRRDAITTYQRAEKSTDAR